MIFSWNDWNVDHIAAHGVTPAEAEHVVRRAEPPYPKELPGDKLLVWGRTPAGRYLQVVFVFPADEEVDAASLGPGGSRRVRRGE
jgi:hypothetical protein